jgi:hypothetical protein
MYPAINKQVLHLLVRAYNRPILDFYYFPDLILIGEQRLEEEEFLFLLSEAYIEKYKYDSFGRFYKLSKKAEQMLYTALVLKGTRKKRPSVSPVQGCFFFA